MHLTLDTVILVDNAKALWALRGSIGPFITNKNLINLTTHIFLNLQFYSIGYLENCGPFNKDKVCKTECYRGQAVYGKLIFIFKLSIVCLACIAYSFLLSETLKFCWNNYNTTKSVLKRYVKLLIMEWRWPTVREWKPLRLSIKMDENESTYDNFFCFLIRTLKKLERHTSKKSLISP